MDQLQIESFAEAALLASEDDDEFDPRGFRYSEELRSRLLEIIPVDTWMSSAEIYRRMHPTHESHVRKILADMYYQCILTKKPGPTRKGRGARSHSLYQRYPNPERAPLFHPRPGEDISELAKCFNNYTFIS